MKTFCFDLDQTLCTTQGTDYKNSKPIPERIKLVNSLYEDGNRVIIDTARGSGTGICWTKITADQLNKWGLKYHKLRCGHKIAADFYIDDKALSDKDFFG